MEESMKSRIVELGRQLGLSAEQIREIMDDTLHGAEPVSLSLGPPYYPGTHYGTVSIADFKCERTTRKIKACTWTADHPKIADLGGQLGLPPELIDSIMDATPASEEPCLLSLGPPHYPGGFYGTVSRNDFDIL